MGSHNGYNYDKKVQTNARSSYISKKREETSST